MLKIDSYDTSLVGTSVLQFQVQNEIHYSHLAVNQREKCDAIRDDLGIEPATDLKIRFHIFNHIITRHIFRVLKPSGTISVIIRTNLSISPFNLLVSHLVLPSLSSEVPHVMQLDKSFPTSSEAVLRMTSILAG